MCSTKASAPSDRKALIKDILCSQKRVPLFLPRPTATATVVDLQGGFWSWFQRTTQRESSLSLSNVVVFFPFPAQDVTISPQMPTHTSVLHPHTPARDPVPSPDRNWTAPPPSQPHIFLPELNSLLRHFAGALPIFHTPSIRISTFIFFLLSSFSPSLVNTGKRAGRHREQKSTQPFNYTAGGWGGSACEWHRISRCRSVHMSGPLLPSSRRFSCMGRGAVYSGVIKGKCDV